MTKKDLKTTLIELVKQEKQDYTDWQKYKKIYNGGANTCRYYHSMKKRVFTPSELALIKRYSAADHIFFKMSLEEKNNFLKFYKVYTSGKYHDFHYFSQVKANFFMACLRHEKCEVKNIHDLENSKDHAKYMDLISEQMRSQVGVIRCKKAFIIKCNEFKMFDNLEEYYDVIREFGPSNASLIHCMPFMNDTWLIYDKPIVTDKRVVNFSNNMMKNDTIVEYLSKRDKKLKDVPDIIINHKLF